MKKTPNLRKPQVQAEVFVRAWQISESFELLLKTTGLSETSARARANHYRKKGIPLKRFPGQRMDRVALTKLAVELAPPGSLPDLDEPVASVRSIRPPAPASPPSGRRDLIAKRAGSANGDFPRPSRRDENDE